MPLASCHIKISMTKASRGTFLSKAEQVFKTPLAMASGELPLVPCIFSMSNLGHILRCGCNQAPCSVLTPCILPGMPFLGMILEGISGEDLFTLIRIVKHQRSLCSTKLYEDNQKKKKKTASYKSNANGHDAKKYEDLWVWESL